MNDSKHMTLGEVLRRGMPTMPYLNFVGQLQGRSQPQLGDQSQLRQYAYYYDPFTIDLRNSPEEEEQSFIERKGVLGSLLGSQVILGKPGTGKTRLYRKLLKTALDHPSSTFTVSLPMESFAQEVDIQGGKMSSLSMKLVIQSIFEEYWNQYVLQPFWRGKYPAPFKSRPWLLRLHWFYNHFTPAWREIPRDPELTAWLSDSLAFQPLREDLSFEQALEQLIKLITDEPKEVDLSPIVEQKEKQFIPLKRIELLLDGVEQLSEFAVSRLICDVQRLYDLRLSFKLFLNPVHEKLLDNLECYRQGRISLLRLPDWSAGELAEMINQRWLVFKPGEVSFSLEQDLKEHLHPDLNGKFIGTIIENVLLHLRNKTLHSENEELAAPVHTLKIIRGVVASCAGCFKDPFGIEPPLRTRDLDQVTKEYWATFEENRR